MSHICPAEGPCYSIEHHSDDEHFIGRAVKELVETPGPFLAATLLHAAWKKGYAAGLKTASEERRVVAPRIERWFLDLSGKTGAKTLVDPSRIVAIEPHTWMDDAQDFQSCILLDAGARLSVSTPMRELENLLRGRTGKR